MLGSRSAFKKYKKTDKPREDSSGGSVFSRELAHSREIMYVLMGIFVAYVIFILLAIGKMDSAVQINDASRLLRETAIAMRGFEVNSEIDIGQYFVVSSADVLHFGEKKSESGTKYEKNAIPLSQTGGLVHIAYSDENGVGVVQNPVIIYNEKEQEITGFCFYTENRKYAVYENGIWQIESERPNMLTETPKGEDLIFVKLKCKNCEKYLKEN